MPTPPTRTATVTERPSPLPPTGTPLAHSFTLHPHAHPAAPHPTHVHPDARNLPPQAQPAAPLPPPQAQPAAPHIQTPLIFIAKTHTLHPAAATSIKPTRPSTSQFHEYLGPTLSPLGTNPQNFSHPTAPSHLTPDPGTPNARRSPQQLDNLRLALSKTRFSKPRT